MSTPQLTALRLGGSFDGLTIDGTAYNLAVDVPLQSNTSQMLPGQVCVTPSEL